MEAHPFIFGASKALGYQGVALPSTFADSKSLAFLERSCADFGVGSGEAFALTTVHPDHGPLSLFFRTRHATNADIGGADSTLLGDQYGRRIVLSEGVLVRGHHLTMKLTCEQLDQASAACRSQFTEFWEAHEWPTEKAISTQPFPLARQAGDTTLKIVNPMSPESDQLTGGANVPSILPVDAPSADVVARQIRSGIRKRDVERALIEANVPPDIRSQLLKEDMPFERLAEWCARLGKSLLKYISTNLPPHPR